MITFIDAIDKPIAAVEKTRVDCGTCPFSLACIVGQGGNGWKFDCCGMTGFIVGDEDNAITVAIDCQKNNFEQGAKAKTWTKCPLCSGGIIEVVERARRDEGKDSNRYLLTVHAKVPLAERLELWKKKREDAIARIQEEHARKTA